MKKKSDEWNSLVSAWKFTEHQYLLMLLMNEKKKIMFKILNKFKNLNNQ